MTADAVSIDNGLGAAQGNLTAAGVRYQTAVTQGD